MNEKTMGQKITDAYDAMLDAFNADVAARVILAALGGLHMRCDELEKEIDFE